MTTKQVALLKRLELDKPVCVVEVYGWRTDGELREIEIEVTTAEKEVSKRYDRGFWPNIDDFKTLVGVAKELLKQRDNDE